MSATTRLPQDTHLQLCIRLGDYLVIFSFQLNCKCLDDGQVCFFLFVCFFIIVFPEPSASLAGFPGSSVIKRILLLMLETQEMPVQSLSREDALEEGMATHSSVLAWRVSWTDEPGGLQSMGS